MYFDGLESRQRAIALPLEGTFDWIWEEKKCHFRTWLKSGRGLYQILGRAAAGKSTLMKHIFVTSEAEARNQFDLEKRPIVVGYFLDRNSKNPMARTSVGVLRAILWQLSEHPILFKHMSGPYEKMKKGRPSVNWSSDELLAILKDILSHKPSHSIWLFLDALDESSEEAIDMVDFCKSFADNASKKIRICVSSRDEPEIVHSLVSNPNLTLRIEQYTRRDIETYTARELSRVEAFVSLKVRQQLVRKVSDNANGLFMWVRLVSRDLVRSSMNGTSTEGLFDCLTHLRQEMHVLYLQILQRREKTPRQEAELMLGIVACARRSLSLAEFQLILEGRVPKAGDENEEFKRRIDGAAGGLLDYRTGSLVFSHQTVSDFFRQYTPSPNFQAHERLAKSCLRVLRDCEPPAPSQRHSSLSDERLWRNLRSYSLLNWIHHWKAAHKLAATIAEEWAPELVTNRSFIHWRRLYLARYWEQEHVFAASAHPVSTAFGFLVLSVIPCSIFFQSKSNAGATVELLPLEDPLQDPLQDRPGVFSGSKNWENHNLDVLVCVEFGPGYSIGIHARHLLVANANAMTMRCKIIRPDDAPKEDSSVQWFHLYLKSPDSQEFGSNVTIIEYKYSSFLEEVSDVLDLDPEFPLLQQLKLLLKHTLQLNDPLVTELREHGCVSSGIDRLLPGHGRVCFATPLHYAAFYGLTLLMQELHKSGADPNSISKESRYGTPLLAAIWGLHELRFGSVRIPTIKLLLDMKASANQVGNGPNMGVMTPLNAAVTLFTGYNKRVGFGCDDMKWVISFLLEQGGQVDPATRTLANASSELQRHFRHDTAGTRELFGAPVKEVLSGSPSASSLPMDIPARRGSYSSSFHATIGNLGPIRTNQYLINPRLIQSGGYNRLLINSYRYGKPISEIDRLKNLI